MMEAENGEQRVDKRQDVPWRMERGGCIESPQGSSSPKPCITERITKVIFLKLPDIPEVPADLLDSILTCAPPAHGEELPQIMTANKKTQIISTEL